MDEDQATCSVMKRDVKTIGPIFSAIFKRFLDVFERKLQGEYPTELQNYAGSGTNEGN